VGATGAVATAAYVVQGALGEQLPEGLHWALLGVGAVLTVAALVQTEQITSQASHRRAAAEQTTRSAEQSVLVSRTKINDGLKSFVTLLDGVVNAHTKQVRDNLQRAMVEVTINFASVYLGADRTRACFFEYEAGPPRRLKCVSSTGRDDEPRTEFVDGTDEGKHIFAVLESKTGTILWPDVVEKPPPGASDSTTYKTFISARVASGTTLYGMLGVDSPEAGTLTVSDEIFVGIIAHMLGIARAAGVKQGR
jgi:hypothetical protein